MRQIVCFSVLLYRIKQLQIQHSSILKTRDGFR
jgi:hypothetical protein